MAERFQAHRMNPGELRRYGMLPSAHRIGNQAHRSLGLAESIVYAQFKKQREEAKALERQQRLDSLVASDPLSRG